MPKTYLSAEDRSAVILSFNFIIAFVGWEDFIGMQIKPIRNPMLSQQ